MTSRSDPTPIAISDQERSGRIFTFPVRVYYEDTDFSGIVYHANYLKFMERARSEALRSCGITHAALLERDNPIVFAVRRMDTQWLAPARIDDALSIKTRFQRITGARLTLTQIIEHQDLPSNGPTHGDGQDHKNGHQHTREQGAPAILVRASVEIACLAAATPVGRSDRRHNPVRPARIPEDVRRLLE